MSHALVPSFCDLRCHHRLPFNDCLVRAVLRALHAHYPDCPIVVLFFVGVVVGAIGWKLRDAAPGSVYPGVHLTRPIGTTILLHATVLAPVVHDDAVVIYVCAITHVSFGSSVVHLPPRLLLLEIPVGAPNKLGICDTDCECGIHFAGASRLVLAALRHRLLQYPIETVPITAVSLLPSIDYYMNFVVPPAQYVDTFTEHIGTSVAGPVAHDILQDNGQLPLPVIDLTHCSLPVGTLVCRCNPVAIGATEIIDSDYVQTYLDHEADPTDDDDEEDMGEGGGGNMDGGPGMI